jgi:chorismate mutase/prephenate dehydratase
VVHFLGPERTFAHAAALSMFKAGETLVPEPSVLDVFEALNDNPSDLGLVPIENTIEGSVTMTLEALAATEDLLVVGEVVIEIEQCLMGQGPLAGIRRVLSHPHALAQCKHWLRKNLPHAQLVTTPSTAAGATECRGRPENAAVGSELAAEPSELLVLARGIQDQQHNATRFVVLGRKLPPASGRDKTSVLFDAPHERGALRRALAIFDDNELNLSRIESRPMRGERWKYFFYADIEGHVDDPPVARALQQLRQGTRRVKVLGSYPQAPEL